MVTIPELRKGGLAVVFASIFVSPPSYPDRTEDMGKKFEPTMEAEAKEQLGIYQQWEDEGLVRIIRSRQSLEAHLTAWAKDDVVGLLIDMESAEPIPSPDELEWWFDAGVRAIGPAWGPTRYCGGYFDLRGQAGGFTKLGENLLAAMSRLGIFLDLAHISVEGFRDGLGHDGPVALTHTIPRALLNIERFPDDEMLAALSARGGVSGLGLGNLFVKPSSLSSKNRVEVTLEDVAHAFEKMADGTGWDRVGIGSDFDGGFGMEECPVGIDSSADIHKVGGIVPAEARAGVLGDNWLTFLKAALPA